MPERPVDLIRCLCRALDLDEHGYLAPDLSRLCGGGYITREGALRLALELCEAAGADLVREARAAGWRDGRESGYAEGRVARAGDEGRVSA